MKKNRGFILVTVLLILIAAFSITGTVKSQSGNGVKIDTEYYRQMEREYVREIRTYLGELGYENSGVMLTYVTKGGNGREYTVTVHHEKMNALSETEKMRISNEILKMAFNLPDCTFFQEFLSV